MTDQFQCPCADSLEAAAQASRLEDDHQPAEVGSTLAALPWSGLHYE
ncbi:hypothetical protein QFZ23_002135 [Arthrobacter globiformis]|nr:hypothetical protein [Arthrobacter globiformis]MDQ1058234.1 hypothetical protein [Arthrobacter globiformis]